MKIIIIPPMGYLLAYVSGKSKTPAFRHGWIQELK